MWVELGLQTADDKVGRFINRCYDREVFEEAVRKLGDAGIGVVVHVIVGLPFEGPEETKATIRYLAKLRSSGLHIDGIKLHLMHVLSGTELGRLYERGEAHLHEYSLEEYADLIVDLLELIPGDVVIHRMTGDAPRRLLVAPLWSTDKKRALNTIARRLRERDTWQGRLA